MARWARAGELFRDEIGAIDDSRRRLRAGQLLSLLPGVALIGIGVLVLRGAMRRERATSRLERHEAEHHEPLEAISP